MNANHPILKLGAASALIAFAFTGCMTREERGGDEGESAMISEEAANMGEVLNLEATALAKAAPDTFTGEILIEKLHWVPACQCFVRKVSYEGARGYERTRYDSIWLYDAQGVLLGDSLFRPSLAGRVVHNRHVVKSKNGYQVDLHFNTIMDWRLSGSDRVGVWNGTISGTFRGVEFKRGEIKDVVRPMLLGRFGFPISGTIHIERWIFTIDIVFEGGGNATATITNTQNGNVHIVHIKRT